MSTAEVAIATCSTHPHAEPSDRPLLAALARLNIPATRIPWNDPAADWSRFSAATIRSTWDWHLHPAAFAAWIDRAGAATTLINPPQTLRWGLDKSYLFDLARKNVPTVPSILIKPADRSRIPDLAYAHNWPHFVVKPTLGATAWRTSFTMTGRDPLHAWRFANADYGGDALLQPFLHSIATTGELSIIAIAGRITHAVLKRPTSGDWRVQGDFGGTATLVDAPPEARRIAEACLAALPAPTLYARIDLVPDDRPAGVPAPWLVIECEVVEPELFFDLAPAAADTLAHAIVAQLP